MTTFYEFQHQFPDDEACLKRIMVERYGGTKLDCPKCGVHGNFYRLTRERAFVCQHCKHQLHPTVGTIMERSRTPLHKWFYAMHMFSTSRHGVAAKELQRQIGVTYKTAWRMAHEIRKYMAEVDGEWPLGGEVGSRRNLCRRQDDWREARTRCPEQDSGLRDAGTRRRRDGEGGSRREEAHVATHRGQERRAGQHGPYGRTAVLQRTGTRRLQASHR